LTTQADPAAETLRRTPLYERHDALGARIVPFAGWEMPVQYRGIIAEHKTVRSAAGLFDLGHMGQIDVHGPDALPYLQAITTNDVAVLEPGDAQYSLLPNERGGVIDDIIVYRRPDGDGYMVVVNASNRDKDFGWFAAQREARPGGHGTRPYDVSIADISDQTGMIAIQGPRAAAITQRLTETPLDPIGAFGWTNATVAGVPALVARTGYTGEDGFEIFTPIGPIGEVWDALLAEGKSDGIEPIGLGARDSLRLEARMPLYGQELSDEIGPLEAGLGWAVKLDKGDFVGRGPIAAMKERGAPRRTVGFKLSERSGAPRTGYDVQLDGRTIGFVTSGAMSPTLGENIGLALIEREAAGVGKPLQVIVRDRCVPAVQVKTPFYKRPGKE
jgi:aminomethyltransferase